MTTPQENNWRDEFEESFGFEKDSVYSQNFRNSILDFISTQIKLAEEREHDRVFKTAQGAATQEQLKKVFTDGAEKERKRCLQILTDEIATAHTTKSGKTSRLTSAYNRIKESETNTK